jgi:phenylalanyl-tRNA synthetase beta chain
MRASHKWLEEFVRTGLSPDEVARLLTMSGLEIEGTEELEGDVIFEVNVTPNRGDCLSILGIARELSALTGVALELPPYKVTDEAESSVRVEIAEEDLCSRYMGRVIKNVGIGPSPEWITKRLESHGIRPINNVVDITNYVLLELGHPLHAFDLQTLKGGLVRVDAAKNISLDFVTLDAIERKLPPDACVIADAKDLIALGGIMGGLDTEVQDTTKNIFLEAAWFNPKSIRKTSKLLGLGSESSYRFERGADIEIIPMALARASYLIKEIAGGVPSGVVDAYPKKFKPKEIQVNVKRVNKLLGTDIPADEMGEIFQRLGFSPEKKEDSIFITVPSWRPDMEREADAAEEVARIYGYEKIPSVMPCSGLSTEGIGIRYEFIKQVKNAVRESGFHEAINYSFMNPLMLDILTIPEGDTRRKAVHVMNPLRQEESFLRTALAPSLLENLRHNTARGVREIRLFEAGKIFIANAPGELPTEIMKLGGLLLSEKMYRFWKEPGETFYALKGVVEGLLNELLIRENIYSFVLSAEPFLHPGKSADVLVGGEKIGYLGVVSPTVKEALDIKVKEEAVLFELDLDILLSLLPPTPEYKGTPRFQGSERDIALVLDENIPAGNVLKMIKDYPSELIEDAIIFDLYKGEKIPAGKKSLAFNIRYRAKDRTLTEEEVERAHKGLVEYLLKETGGTLR